MRKDVSVVFINGKSLASRFIRLVTNSCVTHVYIDTLDGSAIQSEWHGGVQIIPIELASADSDEVARFFIRDIDLSRIYKIVGSPYDWWALPVAVLGKIFKRKIYDKDKSFICTEVVSLGVFGKQMSMTPDQLLLELSERMISNV